MTHVEDPPRMRYAEARRALLFSLKDLADIFDRQYARTGR